MRVKFVLVHHEEAVAFVAPAAGDPAVLADGFSCRTQIAELDSGGRTAMHLAGLLASGRPAWGEP